MDPYYDLAYALESKSLCLILGTGFSKHITNNSAPDWLNLLKMSALKLNDGAELCEELFPNDKPVMPLEECAAVIQLRMQYRGMCLYTEIAEIINSLELSETSEVVESFFTDFDHLKLITTNYDRLVDRDILTEKNCTTYGRGYPANRQPKGIQIYHIHGSIKFPKKMIVTANDYFSFLSTPDYFSSKVETLIEENISVIMGYSLSDINIKSILNKLRVKRNRDINRQSLLFLSRKKIPNHIKDYYDKSYGLRVIDETNIDDFLTKLRRKHELIRDRVPELKSSVFELIDEIRELEDGYVERKDSFYEIIATLSSNGVLISHIKVTGFLVKVLSKKNELTSVNGAWRQYEHLAGWLVHLGAIMDIHETALEEPFLRAVATSFQNMSKKLVLGKSWYAFGVWRKGWHSLTFDNRCMIVEYYEGKHISEDIKEVIEQE